ncbi:uncharacterized protein LOC108433712 [Pygocentrus nattereri]|uniref:exodeoxyribonuclease III n=1 Tax=Pygocentrus nattereri TaxID=42514 RepID=A0AAR2M446_PYGNA|nr:uncharacterized protein LOC108433712 [Pygocentrus nattereri]
MAASLPPKLRFLTWNVNGLETALRIKPHRQPDRQKDVRKELEEADVVFLQETHIKRGNEDVMREFPEWHQFYTILDKAERGVAILIKKTISFEYIHPRQDDDGFIVLHCKLEHQPYTLVSVYHHQKDEAILSRLSEYLQNNATGMMVIGGDFNAVFSPFIDKKEPTINQSHSVLLNRLKLFMRSLQLVDVWRWLHNFMRFYTYYRRESTSRIDFFFVPEECLWRVQSCEIEDVPANDHLPVSLELNNAAVSSGYSPKDIPIKYTFTNCDVRCTIEDITTAIKSLQVSDTRRQDKIPASVYKTFATDGRILQYLQILYNRILDGSFDVIMNHFNDSIQCQIQRQGKCQNFHFFNVDYVILATILARHLDEKLESLLRRHRRPNYNTRVAMIYYFPEVPESVEMSLLEHAFESASLSPEFQALKKILRRSPSYGASQSYLLCQGCPLTPLLHSLLLRYVTERSVGVHNTGDIEIYAYKYFVNVVVPNNSPLGRPDEINVNGLQVRRNIATSLEHVYVYNPQS